MENDNRTCKAKFHCLSVTNKDAAEGEINQTARLEPVYGDSEENKTFSKFTPSGDLSLTITNPELKDFFKPGKEYVLDINEA